MYFNANIIQSINIQRTGDEYEFAYIIVQILLQEKYIPLIKVSLYKNVSDECGPIY